MASDSDFDFQVTVIKEELEIDEQRDVELVTLQEWLRVKQEIDMADSDSDEKMPWMHDVLTNLTLYGGHDAFDRDQKPDLNTLPLDHNFSMIEGRNIKTEMDDIAMEDGKSNSLRVNSYNSSDNTLKCDMCEKRFSGMKQLMSHAKRVHSSKMYECDTCGCKYKNRSTLRLHLRIHTNERPFKCNLCDYRCAQGGNLKSHIMRIHTYAMSKKNIPSNAEKLLPFKCNICNFKTANKASLKKHIGNHNNINNEKQFECNLCGCKLSNKGSLKIHKRIHTNEKPFKCNLCEYRSSQSGNLKSHVLRIHMQPVYDVLKVLN